MEESSGKQHRSGLAIAGLIIGILALLTSLMPFINNISFFVALIGAALAIAGMVSCVRGKRAGKGLAGIAIVVNVVAVAAVLMSQSMYGAAVDDAMNGPQAVQSSEGDGKQKEVQEQPVSELAIGSKVELENGLSVTVNEVASGLVNFDGAEVTRVNVTYENNGDEPISFNSYDWKGENETGVRSDTTYFSDEENAINYGDLSVGGSVSGNVYFDGTLTKVLYFSSPFADDPAATWIVA